MTLSLLLMASLLAGADTGAQIIPQSQTPLSVVAVEWLPLRSHSVIMREIETGIKQKLGDLRQPAIERINLFADPVEMKKTLTRISEDPPSLVVGFEDYVCQEICKLSGRTPILALLARDREGLEASRHPDRAPLLQVESEPSPALIWRVARELKPDLTSLGIIYTVDYAPNKVLAKKLAEAEGAKVVGITVGAGYCRTDSDFDTTLRKRHQEEPFGLLYVPSDPNCSRFGVQIFRTAQTLGVPAVGTEATIGKGCVAALTLDYVQTGKNAVAQIVQLLGLATLPADGDAVRVVVDHAALELFHLKLSPWLTENIGSGG